MTGTFAWRCQECGYTFRSVKTAEKASFGDDGCPGCGGSDIDMSLPVGTPAPTPAPRPVDVFARARHSERDDRVPERLSGLARLERSGR